MSEYQYYEFRAIDRPLTREEQAYLRRYSTRAEITATGFTNEYNWGDFKGNTDEWMDHSFDAFLYLANWGTRVLKFRIPSALLSEATVDSYAPAESFTVRESGANTILTFQLSELELDDWQEGEGLLASMLAVREELAMGDLRGLYLGWLISVENGELADEDPEPPVSAGLADLTEAQQELASFFFLDQDLIRTAAQASPSLRQADLPLEQIGRWLENSSAKEKDDLLARLIAGDEPHLARTLYLQAVESPQDRQTTERTVGELLATAKEVREERERVEAERRAAERARREREEAAARAKYLDSLAGREGTVWDQAESLVATKVAGRYAEAVNLLTDLRDLAERGDLDDFKVKMLSFKLAHAKKPALIDRLDRAGL